MMRTSHLLSFVALIALATSAYAATSEVADAAMRGDQQLLRAAIARKADVNAPQVNGSASMLDRLLKAGADPNAALSSAGDTALMMAARTGKADALRVLLESGANVNAKETWGGTTALMWAVSEGHTDAVKALVAAG